MITVDASADGQWIARDADFETTRWRFCAHRASDACNWLLAPQEPGELCRSCRLSTHVPDLGVPQNLDHWKRCEAAKQWVVHQLLELGLPFDPPDGGSPPLRFRLLAPIAGESVTTGHADGTITLDVAEADDAERARRRAALGEAYRTLLGHFRHEVGHYFWMVMAQRPAFLAEFRLRFGHEGADYAAALRKHYESGPPADWQNDYISAYAACHPWEDFAECWAHFMHISDSIETARAHWLRIDGNTLVEQWLPVSLLVNDLNRSAGMPDAYPFVVTEGVRDKIEFIAQAAATLASASRPVAAGPR